MFEKLRDLWETKKKKNEFEKEYKEDEKRMEKFDKDFCDSFNESKKMIESKGSSKYSESEINAMCIQEALRVAQEKNYRRWSNFSNDDLGGLLWNRIFKKKLKYSWSDIEKAYKHLGISYKPHGY